MHFWFDLIFCKKEWDLFSKAFSILDKNGEISCQELQQVLLAVGKTGTKEEVEQIMKRVDKDENGSVSFPELLDMMRYLINHSIPYLKNI